MSAENSATKSREEFSYQAEMTQLLELIVHSLYQHKDIFLRELISNASDALNKVRFKQVLNEPVFDPEAPLEITISYDSEAGTLTIQDRGIGMTRAELVENLGTIARSGTKNFLKKMEVLKEADSEQRKDLIGQFGVGFYSAFMVADKVEVATRSADPDAEGCLWVSEGGTGYSIESFDKAERGTTITLHLKEADEEYADEERITGIVRKYSRYLSYPVKLNEEQLNETQALWTRPKKDVTAEQTDEFYQQLATRFDKPLLTLHASVETPIQYHALIFVPGSANQELLYERQTKGLKLYCRKVFVSDEDMGLLPSYLRFAVGVVDSEDMPLNVSREVVQSNPMANKISNSLTDKLLKEIEHLAANEPERFKTLWKEFGRFLKEGLQSDFKRKEKLTELLHFETSKGDEGALHPLRAYVERMHPDQKQVLYVSGESRKAALRNPKMELFKKHDVEVLILTDPVDEFVMSVVPKYKDKDIVELDRADLSWLPAQDEKDRPAKADSGELEALLKKARELLKDRVEDVREGERLVDSPATLVAGKESMSPHMERMLKLMNKEFSGSKRVLELNARNPIIKGLAKLAEKSQHDELVKDGLEQLVETALLLEGELVEPQELVRRDHAFMEKVLNALIG